MPKSFSFFPPVVVHVVMFTHRQRVGRLLGSWTGEQIMIVRHICSQQTALLLRCSQEPRCQNINVFSWPRRRHDLKARLACGSDSCSQLCFKEVFLFCFWCACYLDWYPWCSSLWDVLWEVTPGLRGGGVIPGTGVISQWQKFLW